MQIKEILREKGMTKAELARRTGILPGNLNGALRNPTEGTIRKMAAALDVPISRLFQEETPVKTYATIHCPNCKKLIRIEVTCDQCDK